MPPDRSSFKALNAPPESVPRWMGSFDLSAPPNTDLWRKPPSRDTSTAPILYTALRQRFTSADVVVSADLAYEWDQAGLVIFAGVPPGRETLSRTAGSNRSSMAPSQGGDATPSTSSPVEPNTLQSLIQDNTTRPRTQGSGAVQPSHSSNVTNGEIDQTLDHRQAPPPYPQSVAASKWVKLSLELSSNVPHATAVVATPDGADWSATTLPIHGPPHNRPAFPENTNSTMTHALAVPQQPLRQLSPISMSFPSPPPPFPLPSTLRGSHRRQRRRAERRRHDDGYETLREPLMGLAMTPSRPPPGAISPTNLPLGPVPVSSHPPPYIQLPRPTHSAALRLKMERLGDALWLWYQPIIPATPSSGDSDPTGALAENSSGLRPGEWVKLREVTWFFFGVEDKAIRIGVYASRPANIVDRTGGSGSDEATEDGENGSLLTVKFDGLEIF